jgi:hypothetical protein
MSRNRCSVCPRRPFHRDKSTPRTNRTVATKAHFFKVLPFTYKGATLSLLISILPTTFVALQDLITLQAPSDYILTIHGYFLSQLIIIMLCCLFLGCIDHVNQTVPSWWAVSYVVRFHLSRNENYELLFCFTPELRFNSCSCIHGCFVRTIVCNPSLRASHSLALLIICLVVSKPTCD